MAAPTETPPATTATEPEVAKDAKDATLTVDVAAAVDKGDTKQQSPEPPEGLLACGIGPFHPNADAVQRDMKRRRMEALADDSDEDKEAEDKKDEEDAEPHPGTLGVKAPKPSKPKEVSESVKRAREAAETLEEALHKDDDKAAEEAPKDKEEEAPKEEEKAMPPAVQRQMTTLSPEAAVAPPTLRREATVAA